MYLLKSRFKILFVLVPFVVFFLGLDLDAGNPTERSVNRQDPQQKITKAEFDRLPDDYVFIYEGRKVTKAQILKRFNNMRRNSRRIEKMFTPAELKARSEREHQERVKKENLKVLDHIKMQAKSDRPRKMVASQRPGITSTFCVPPLSPDEDIYIKGYNFEDNNLKVKLLGNFPNGSADLIVMDLKPNYIHARVSDVKGAPDQPAKLVVSVDGVESNQWPITFEAKRVISMLAAKDYQVLFCHPGYPRSSDICNEHVTSGRESNIFRAKHYYSSLEVGKEIVKAELKNGWYFKEVSCIKWSQAKMPLDPNVQIVWVTGFNTMTERLNLNIDWMYVGAGGISYDIGVLIVGPAGIPYD